MLFNRNKLYAVIVGLSASSESIYQIKTNRSRGNSIRHRPHRVPSRHNKENGGSGSRKKNSIKKSIANSSAIKATSSNNAPNDEKVLKVSFEENSPDSALNKLQVVSFGETPSDKVSSTVNSQHAMLIKPEHIQMNQSNSRKYILTV